MKAVYTEDKGWQTGCVITRTTVVIIVIVLAMVALAVAPEPDNQYSSPPTCSRNIWGTYVCD